MNLTTFFDNLSAYFLKEEDNVPIRASAYKNEEGDIVEIRIFNPEYNSMLVISTKGDIEAIDVDDYVETFLEKK